MAQREAAHDVRRLLNLIENQNWRLSPEQQTCQQPRILVPETIDVEPEHQAMSAAELRKSRPEDRFSRCLARATTGVDSVAEGWSFQRGIELAVAEGARPTKQAGLIEGIGLIDRKGGAYPLPSESDRVAVSLSSRDLCVPKSTSEIGGAKSRSQEVVSLAANFARRHNSLRAISDPVIRNRELQGFWARSFACLASAESLGDPNSGTSPLFLKRIREIGLTPIEKPKGVKYYYDSWQRAKNRSRSELAKSVNVGLYQFSPTAKGNVRPCIESWNQRMGSLQPSSQIPGPVLPEGADSCLIDSEKDQQVFEALASPSQAFNAFCGVQKVVGSFLIQVNTTQSKSTSSQNRLSSKGALRLSAERCVSPHLAASAAYNHFGVLLGTTSSNLKKFLGCALPPTESPEGVAEPLGQ